MSTKILYFSAVWCGPCKSFKPKFEQLAREHADKAAFEMIDADTSELCATYKVRGVPTVVVLENDAEVARGVGVTQIEEALKFLKG